MAFHAIKAGEGDQYIAAGRRGRLALPRRRAVRAHPQAQRLRGLALRRLHPDGQHGRERRRALQGQPRGAGRVGRDLAAPRGRGARRRPLRRRDRPGHHARRHRGHPRRRPAPRHDAREARRAQARLQARRRHGHRRQRLPAQRRRRRGARDVRREAREGARPEPRARIIASSVAAIRPGDHGPRPDPGGQGGARAGRHDDRRHRHARAQRGVRRPGRPVPRRAGASTPRSSTRSAARSRSATRSA